MNFLVVSLVLFVFSSTINGAFVPMNERKMELFRQLLRDNRGCDAVVNSCGRKGACCDDHDACFRANGCTAASWLTMGT